MRIPLLLSWGLWASVALWACDEAAVGPASPDAGDAASSGDPDRVDASCRDPGWTPGACGPGATEARPATAAPLHIPVGTPITYAEHPPASGPHRSTWARWGAYGFLPPERWVHNIEHGGVALLVHPCAPAEMVDALRAWARARPADDGGAFRWVLTPYPELPSAVALVAWEHVYTAECVREGELDAFLQEHYRKAPEDIGADGPYDITWLGR